MNLPLFTLLQKLTKQRRQTPDASLSWGFGWLVIGLIVLLAGLILLLRH